MYLAVESWWKAGYNKVLKLSEEDMRWQSKKPM